jgi:hypothetical protein
LKDLDKKAWEYRESLGPVDIRGRSRLPNPAEL